MLQEPSWPDKFPFKPDFFQRYDEAPDTEFYSQPRSVPCMEHATTAPCREHLRLTDPAQHTGVALPGAHAPAHALRSHASTVLGSCCN